MSDNSIKLDLSADINRDKFFSYNPELIGTVAGVRFYECPWHGDEAPLVAVTGKQCGYSHWHDLPTANEVADALEVGA